MTPSQPALVVYIDVDETLIRNYGLWIPLLLPDRVRTGKGERVSMAFCRQEEKRRFDKIDPSMPDTASRRVKQLTARIPPYGVGPGAVEQRWNGLLGKPRGEEQAQVTQSGLQQLGGRGAVVLQHRLECTLLQGKQGAHGVKRPDITVPVEIRLHSAKDGCERAESLVGSEHTVQIDREDPVRGVSDRVDIQVSSAWPADELTVA